MALFLFLYIRIVRVDLRKGLALKKDYVNLLRYGKYVEDIYRQNVSRLFSFLQLLKLALN